MLRQPQTSITVKHNFEAAHRLFLTPGKCEAIHGHSFWVELSIFGKVDLAGMLGGLDFGVVKKSFRDHIDRHYDHQLLLNVDDPWAQDLDPNMEYEANTKQKLLPGLRQLPGDPTTENLAAWIGQWATSQYTGADAIGIVLDETKVNSASWYSGPL